MINSQTCSASKMEMKYINPEYTYVIARKLGEFSKIASSYFFFSQDNV